MQFKYIFALFISSSTLLFTPQSKCVENWNSKKPQSAREMLFDFMMWKQCATEETKRTLWSQDPRKIYQHIEQNIQGGFENKEMVMSELLRIYTECSAKFPQEKFICAQFAKEQAKFFSDEITSIKNAMYYFSWSMWAQEWVTKPTCPTWRIEEENITIMLQKKSDALTNGVKDFEDYIAKK